MAYDAFEDQIVRLLTTSDGALGWASVLSIGLALWSARAGIAALMRGLNAVYDRPNRAGLRHVMVALLITVSMLGVAIVAIFSVVVIPITLNFFALGEAAEWLVTIVKWAVTFGVLVAALSILYRFGPNTKGRRTRWLTPGAFAAVAVWGAASMLFSVYLSNFSNYNEVYGSLGAVIALLMWLYISAFVLLLGAALNVVYLRSPDGAELVEQPDTEGAAKA